MADSQNTHPIIPEDIIILSNSDIKLDQLFSKLFPNSIDKYIQSQEASEPCEVSSEDLESLKSSLLDINKALVTKFSIYEKLETFDFLSKDNKHLQKCIVLEDTNRILYERSHIPATNIVQVYILLKILDNNAKNQLLNTVRIQLIPAGEDIPEQFRVISDFGLGSLESYQTLRKDDGNLFKYDELLNIARQVHQQIQGLSELGIIHRNITADNLIIQNSGDIKLKNFDYAVITNNKNGNIPIGKNFKTLECNLRDPALNSKSSIKFEDAIKAEYFQLGKLIQALAETHSVKNDKVDTLIKELLEGKCTNSELQPQDDPSTNFLNTYKEKWNKQKAKLGKQSRDSLLKIPTETLSRMITIDRLAEIYQNKELKRAIEAEIQSVLESPSKEDPKNQKTLAFGYGLLATNYLIGSDYENAVKYHTKSLEIYEEVYKDEDSDDVATACNNLATAYYYQKKFEDAVHYYEKSIKIHKKVHGDTHQTVARALKTLAIAFSSQEKFEESINIRKEALDMWVKIHGDEYNEDVIDSYRGLAAIAHAQNEKKKSIDNQQKMIELQSKVYGEESAEVAETYYHIASTYNHYKDLDNCVKNHQKVLELRQKIFGADSEKVIEINFIIGNCYFHEKKYTESLKYYNKGLDLQKILYGENSKELIHTYGTLSMIQSNQKQYTQALESQNAAFEIQKAVFGENSKEAATSYMRYCNIYFSDQKWDKAMENVEKAVTILKKDLGNMVEVINCFKTMAIIHSKKKEFRKSLELLKHCKNLSIQVYQSQDHEKVKELTDAIKNIAYQVSMQEVTFWKFLKSFNWRLGLVVALIAFIIHQLFFASDPYIKVGEITKMIGF